MKKLKTHYALLLIIGSYFMFNGCLPRETNNWKKYAIELQNEGWSVKASEHIAKVEFKILPIDEEYNGYKED